MEEVERLRLLAAARQRRAGAKSVEPSEMNVIATTPDGGKIYQMQDGAQGFTSPGYSTTDPAKVSALMEGATPVELVQNDIDNQRINANPIAARAQEFVRGTPFIGSYADEAVGMFSPDAAKNMRATSGAMQRQNPNETAALNFGGAIAGAVPMAMAAGPAIMANAAPTIGGRALQAAGAGAIGGMVEGAIYGSGEQSGDGRAINARNNAAVGGASGAVLGPLATYGAAGVRSVLSRLKGSDISIIASELGLSNDAAKVVKSALESGGIDNAADALSKVGDDAMLADAGAGTRGLLDTAAQMPGVAGQVARQAVDGRVTAAAAKMTGALDDTLGGPRGLNDIKDSVRDSTKGARSDAYGTAYATPIDYSAGTGRALEGLLGRVPESAIRRAQQIMDVREETSSQIMASIGDNGRVSFQTMPDVKQVHYIMQALDDIAKGTDGAGVMGRQTTYGGSIESLRSQISSTLKRAVPEFGAAQDIAADTARRLEMTDMGRDLLRANTTREDVARSISTASKSEKEAAREGLRSYIDDMTANVARTVTDSNVDAREGLKILRDFSTRGNRQKVELLLGQADSSRLFRELDEATTAYELRAAISQNSKTAARQATDRMVGDVSAGGVLQTLADGEPVNAVKRLTQAITGGGPEAKAIREMGLYEEIAAALTQSRGGRAKASLRIIQNAMDGQAVSDAQARIIANSLVGSTALSAHLGTSQSLSR